MDWRRSATSSAATPEIRGGLVFVLEDRPQHRLLTDPGARDSYERIKRDLAAKFPRDRKAYSAAKQSPVRGLLDHADRWRQQQ